MGLLVMEGGLNLGWRWLVGISTLPLGATRILPVEQWRQAPAQPPAT